MPNYLFLKNKLIINFRESFEKCVFFFAKLTLNIKKKIINLEVTRDNW